MAIGGAGTPWTRQEVDLVVADYFDMLHKELLGQDLNKSDHWRALIPLLNGRSKGSIEFKYQNISAVFVRLGYPYIEGYKPRVNFQASLIQGVEDYLAKHPGFFNPLTSGPVMDPETTPMVQRPEGLFVPPPDRIFDPEDTDKPWEPQAGRRIDFVRRDAENRKLGRMGEAFVLEVEKKRLLDQGRDDLSKKVEWVADTRGDGLGFDILSFDERTDQERLVEVKTTGLGKFFPFYITRNEVRCSVSRPTDYHLYRVFNFATKPKLYVLRGAMSEVCCLEPTQYRATIGA